MKKRWCRKGCIILGWLLVWQIISLLVGNDLLLVGPLETLRALIVHGLEPGFWLACGGSVLRIGTGFLAGMLLGVVLAMLSAKKKWLEEVLEPVMTLLKTVPVASFVVLFLIWWRSAYLAVAISFCVTLPQLYMNTLAGMKSTDLQLLEMAQVFRISGKDKFFYIFRPALIPFWDSAICLAAGMSWKAGVAAEVIGLPANAIGERLYMSKIHLDTAGVLAWTVVTILLSVIFEKVVKACWQRLGKWEPACKGAEKSATASAQVLQVEGLAKAYDGKVVVNKVTDTYEPGQIYYFRTPSGSGKTTLFRLIAGLEMADEGAVEGAEKGLSYLFQEDRLCEQYSAVKNVELITGNAFTAKEELLKLLKAEDLNKPCKELSGGMKRRVALVRAMVAKTPIVLLDEPYNGLDEENREKVFAYIEANAQNRIILMATHMKQNS